MVDTLKQVKSKDDIILAGTVYTKYVYMYSCSLFSLVKLFDTRKKIIIMRKHEKCLHCFFYKKIKFKKNKKKLLIYSYINQLLYN